jgi:hypothetical protein
MHYFLQKMVLLHIFWSIFFTNQSGHPAVEFGFGFAQVSRAERTLCKYRLTIHVWTISSNNSSVFTM